MTAGPARATTPLRDDHPAWQAIGAWVAARQRGDARAVLARWVVDAARERVAAELEVVATLDGAPLRTGAELHIDAFARSVGPDHIDGLQLVLTGRVQGPGDAGPIVSRLGLARLERGDDGAWRIAAIFDDDDRRALMDPAFAELLARRERR